MAKLYGLSGKATGKKGDTVFAVRNGQQIIRQYNPIVTNPNTKAQSDTRSVFKLLVQLAAVLGSYIAIPRVGGKSARNSFTQINFPLCSVAGDKASVPMDQLQITKSAVALPSITVSRGTGNVIQVEVSESVLGEFDKVVYVGMRINPTDGSVRTLGSVTVNVTNENETAAGQMAPTGAAVTVLAYGVKSNSGKADTSFANLGAEAATHIASLVATRTLGSGDLTLSETKGANLAAAA